MSDEPKPLSEEAVQELEALIIDAKSAAEWSWKFPDLFATIAAKDAEIENLKRVGGCVNCYHNGLEYREALARSSDVRNENVALRKRVEKLEVLLSEAVNNDVMSFDLEARIRKELGR